MAPGGLSLATAAFIFTIEARDEFFRRRDPAGASSGGERRDLDRSGTIRRGFGRGMHRDMALVPAASIAGRALVTVVAIMTFLASLTAGAAILISDTSRGWQDEVAREMTIQIRPAAGRDLDADTAKAAELASKTPGIASVRAYSKAQAEELLQPWLGTGLDLSELPVPRLVVVGLDKEERLDIAVLRKKLADAIPGSSIDDHRFWLERLAIMAKKRRLRRGGDLHPCPCRDDPGGWLCDPRHDGGQPRDHRSFAFRWRRGQLYFASVPAAFLPARPARRRDWRRPCDLGFFGLGTLPPGCGQPPAATRWRRCSAIFRWGSNIYGAIALIAAGIAIVTGFVSRVIVYRHLRGLELTRFTSLAKA